MKFLKKVLKVGFIAILPVILVLMVNFWVIVSTAGQIYSRADIIPYSEVGLILGTSKSTTSGTANSYFYERIEAAVSLYNSGKLKYIIVSGDNRTVYYNEPMDMLNALIDKGVPKEDVIMDFAGLSTFESVKRAKEVFGKNDITIITQDFHCYRALYIANHSGITAKAFAADDKQELSGKLAFREILARLKAVVETAIS
ncbi:MAG: SanA protein [Cyclobacteriaceae bacterium]|jgi:SanA protein